MATSREIRTRARLAQSLRHFYGSSFGKNGSNACEPREAFPAFSPGPGPTYISLRSTLVRNPRRFGDKMPSAAWLFCSVQTPVWDLQARDATFEVLGLTAVF